MDSSFCRRLPKLELHAHLNGSLSQKTLKELYDYHKNRNSEKTNNLDISALEKKSLTFSEFFNLFHVTYALTSVPETVQIAVERVIEDFSEDNVVYLELRSTLRKDTNMDKKDYLEAMIKGILHCRTLNPKIIVKVLVSINRSETILNAQENVDLAVEYSAKYPDIVVGIDVSGNPTNSEFNHYKTLLESARSKGLKCSVHCAEVIENKEVKDILDFHPDRIGHGTCIHESFGGCETNWNELLKKKIPVELCISSNIKCHTVESYKKHHFKLLHDVKHPLTLSTDDKGIFNSTLSEEFEIVKQTFSLSELELWTLSYQSIDYTFASDNEKEILRRLLNKWRSDNL